MSTDSLFDSISRILASPMSRRRAFRLIAGGLVSGTAVSLLEPYASGQSVCPTCPGGQVCGTTFGNCDTCCGVECCNIVHYCCGDIQCCEIGDICCNDGFACCDPVNAPVCCGEMCCKPNETCCEMGSTCCANCVNDKCMDNTAQLTVSAVQPGPPMHLKLTVQDKVNGISSLYISQAVNCKVTPTMPMAVGATTNPIAFAATKISHCKQAMIVLGVTDQHGEDEVPKHIILSVLKLNTGTSVSQTFSELGHSTAHLYVTNSSFGFTTLEVFVNGALHNTLSLTNNETTYLDLYSVLTSRSDNTISLVGLGQLGASANVMVTDEPLDPNSTPATASMGEIPPGRNVWGPLAEEIEDNTGSHVSHVATQTIWLNLADVVTSKAVSDPSIFWAETNGETTVVQSVEAHAGPNGSTNLVFQFLPGTFQAGGPCVYISWQNLMDADGRALSGFVEIWPHP